MGKFTAHQEESSKFIREDKFTSKFAPVPTSQHKGDAMKAIHPAGTSRFSDIVCKIMGSFRSRRVSIFSGSSARDQSAFVSGEDAYATELEDAYPVPSAMAVDPMSRALTRSLGQGILVAGVMSAVNGQAIFSQQVLTTGAMAGLGIYLIDMYAPSWGESMRYGIATR